MHIRFRKAFGSYSLGQAVHLPEEIGGPYVKMGIAEVVDRVPVVVGTVKEQVKEEPVVETPAEPVAEVEVTSDADDVAAPKRFRKK